MRPNSAGEYVTGLADMVALVLTQTDGQLTVKYHRDRGTIAVTIGAVVISLLPQQARNLRELLGAGIADAESAHPVDGGER